MQNLGNQGFQKKEAKKKKKKTFHDVQVVEYMIYSMIITSAGRSVLSAIYQQAIDHCRAVKRHFLGETNIAWALPGTSQPVPFCLQDFLKKKKTLTAKKKGIYVTYIQFTKSISIYLSPFRRVSRKSVRKLPGNVEASETTSLPMPCWLLEEQRRGKRCQRGNENGWRSLERCFFFKKKEETKCW